MINYWVIDLFQLYKLEMLNIGVMKVSFKKGRAKYKVNLKKGISISTTFSGVDHLPKAFHAPDVTMEPVRTADFVGSTLDGGLLNFKNLFINPHGNGTHTECVGHIATAPYFIKDTLRKEHHLGQLVTLDPELKNEDTYISKNQVESIAFQNGVNCLIIRTLPNEKKDKLKDWTETNPTYIHHEAMEYLVSKGIEHFMIDVPSVDREHDEGKLLAHKRFWNYPSDAPRMHATITEMVFVSNKIKDGLYLVNIQVLPLAMDASPSNIFIYKVKEC